MWRIGICQFADLQLVKESAVDKSLSSPKSRHAVEISQLCFVKYNHHSVQ
jgi:hypothetical protein